MSKGLLPHNGLKSKSGMNDNISPDTSIITIMLFNLYILDVDRN